MTEKIKQTNKFNLDGLGAKKVVKKPPVLRTWQKVCIALISGALLALAGPGFDQWWLAWFMVAPFLVMISFSRSGESLLIGLAFGLSYHLVSLQYYLGTATLMSGQGLANWRVSALIWLAQAAELSLPVMLFAWFISILPLRPGFIPYFNRPFFPYLIAVPLLWVFLHWGLAMINHSADILQWAPIIPTATDTLVYSQYNLLPMLQILKYIGPVGLEFFLLLFNSAIAACVVELVKRNEGPLLRVDAISPRAGALFDLSVVAIFVAAIYYFGQVQISTDLARSNEFCLYDKANESTQPVLAVGAVVNDPLKSNWRMPVLGKRLAIIIFPEINKERESDWKTNDFLKIIKNSVYQNDNAVILSLACRNGQSITRQNLVVAAETGVSSKQAMYCEDRLTWQNGLLCCDYKNSSNIFAGESLLPGLQEWLSIINKKDWSSWYYLHTPKINWGKVGLLSGTDIEDFRLVANEVRGGASLIVESMNLSWAHNRLLNKQVLAAAIFRAVENHRYVIICANGGIVAIIEPNGAVQSLFLPQIKEKQKDTGSNILLGTVQFLWSKTSFTKTWWL